MGKSPTQISMFELSVNGTFPKNLIHGVLRSVRSNHFDLSIEWISTITWITENLGKMG